MILTAHIISVAFLGLLGYAWTKSSKLWCRVFGTTWIVSLLGTIVFVALLTGTPRDMNVNAVLNTTEKYQLVWARMIQGQPILLLLEKKGEEPKYVKIPWDKELAEKIQRSQDSGRGGEEGEREVTIQMSFPFLSPEVGHRLITEPDK